MVNFRSSRTRSQALAEGTSGRGRAGQIDHDVFEGLPVRRWARQPTMFSQNPKNEVLDTGGTSSYTLPELPMPRDSNLLTPLSRSLLRAARAGCTYIKPVKKDIEIAEKEVKGDESAIRTSYQRTFTAVKWTAIPRSLEPPEVEFLAKRRTGLRSVYGGGAMAAGSSSSFGLNNAASQASMRKTKFKKVDTAAGTVSIYQALVPEGHKVEGEITDESHVTADHPDMTVVYENPVPGMIIEGVGVVDQQGVVVAEPEGSMVAVVRRRHPPPKRKAKGIGRGRKKKVMFAPDGDVPVPASGSADGEKGMTGIVGPSIQPSEQSTKDTGGDEEEEEEDDGDGSEDEEDLEDGSKSQTTEAPVESIPSTDYQNQELDVTAQKGEPEIEPHEQVALPNPLPAPAPSNAPDHITTPTPGIGETVIPDDKKSDDSMSAPPVEPITPAEPPPAELGDSQKISDLPVDIPMQSVVAPEPHVPAMTTYDPARSSAPPEMVLETSFPQIPLANPRKASSLSPGASRGESQPYHFDSGEVDLLGSLEASLDNQARPPEQQPANEPPEQAPEDKQVEPHVMEGEDTMMTG